MPRPSPPSVGAEPPRAAEPTAPDRNVAVGSHGEYVLTVTAAAAWCVNAAVSKATCWHWALTYWPWNWCPSHVWRANFSLSKPLCSRVRPDVRDGQTDVRRQTKASLNASALWGGGIINFHIHNYFVSTNCHYFECYSYHLVRLLYVMWKRMWKRMNEWQNYCWFDAPPFRHEVGIRLAPYSFEGSSL